MYFFNHRYFWYFTENTGKPEFDSHTILHNTDFTKNEDLGSAYFFYFKVESILGVTNTLGWIPPLFNDEKYFIENNFGKIKNVA